MLFVTNKYISLIKSYLALCLLSPLKEAVIIEEETLKTNWQMNMMGLI